MKKLALLLFVIGTLTACRNEKDKTGKRAATQQLDTLAYVYDSVKVYSKNIVNTDTATAVVKYPVFKNPALNVYIEGKVFNSFGEKAPVNGYQAIAKSFIKEYDDFYVDDKFSSSPWFLMIDLKVIRQTEAYVAIEYLHSDYAGGAHPNTMISYLNFNPKNNTPITLDSLIETGKNTELVQIAEQIFRKQEGLTDTASLTEQYFFDKGKFVLPTSFYVSPNGLVFLYNPYEIKPYAAGITKLTIPFAQLKHIAKPNTILSKSN
jgi:hypothetical protein